MQEVKNFKRQELFDKYHICNNPFIICTIKVEVTSLVNYCKRHKNFYATLGFVITKTVNEIEEFKFRFANGKIYYCDIINSNYTQMHDDEIGYFSVPFISDIAEYTKTFLEKEKLFKESSSLNEGSIDEIWLSCTPWFSFSSLIPPFNKDIPIPQFIWDKYELINDKYYLDLMIMTHHGFTDGYHINKFIELLQKNISTIC